MSYETLDNIADSFIPILGFFVLLSITLGLRLNYKSLHNSGIRFVLLLCLLIVVYLMMFIDEYLGLWHKLGGLDYSTHTALSLVLTLFLVHFHKRYKSLLTVSFIGYLLLMLYQGYHTVADMAVTGIVIGVLGFGVLKIKRAGSEA